MRRKCVLLRQKGPVTGCCICNSGILWKKKKTKKSLVFTVTWLICSAQVIVVTARDVQERNPNRVFQIWRCPSTFQSGFAASFKAVTFVLLWDWLDGNESSSERFCLCCQCLQAVHAFPSTAAAAHTHTHITHVQRLLPGLLGIMNFTVMALAVTVSPLSH